MVLLATMPVLAANITVGSPAAGVTLEIGKSLPIAWTFAGLANSTKVTISLWQGAGKLGNIIEDLAIGSAGQGDFHVNGVVDESFPVPAIDPGATATVTRIWKLACPGTVKIIIDPGQANVDPDMANNVWQKVFCTN